MNISFFKRNASTILTCIGAVGVIATSFLAVKATPKALRVIEEKKEEKGEELTKLEVIKTAGPAYIPAVVTGASTLVCIFGANVLNTQHQAAITSAYALLQNSYSEYKKKVEELYGEEAADHIEVELAKDKYEEYEDEIEDGEQLFFDLSTMQYFRSTMDEVIQKTVMEDGMECYVISTPYSSDLAMVWPYYS